MLPSRSFHSKQVIWKERLAYSKLDTNGRKRKLSNKKPAAAGVDYIGKRHEPQRARSRSVRGPLSFHSHLGVRLRCGRQVGLWTLLPLSVKSISNLDESYLRKYSPPIAQQPEDTTNNEEAPIGIHL